ncbi:MAG: rhodanese-related sulfurtransferase [Cyclonatronaceae bacterium]
MYNVILYYNFSTINDPQSFCTAHREMCRSLGLKGRIYIATEGINGTLAGKNEDIEAYKSHLTAIPGFEKTEFKEDASDSVPFAKLIVKIRPEIVALRVDDPLDPAEGGRHLQPSEWRRVMETEKDYVLIDVRNNYESRIGHFEGALRPDVENFYDFPKWLEEAQIPRDKKVLMYCTGGIRCEKFSVLMKKKGWNDVNQLHGGILNYAREEGGAHFRGKCFVFDDRLVVPVNPDDEEPISHCEITGTPCDTYINCANMECNKLFVCSEEGAALMEGTCCEQCKNSPYKRPFNAENAFAPFRKWYNYFGSDFKQREHQHVRDGYQTE